MSDEQDIRDRAARNRSVARDEGAVHEVFSAGEVRWMIEEIDRLRAEVEQAKDREASMADDIESLTAEVERFRAEVERGAETVTMTGIDGTTTELTISEAAKRAGEEE